MKASGSTGGSGFNVFQFRVLIDFRTSEGVQGLGLLVLEGLMDRRLRVLGFGVVVDCYAGLQCGPKLRALNHPGFRV